jgi:hypothetical protein
MFTLNEITRDQQLTVKNKYGWRKTRPEYTHDELCSLDATSSWTLKFIDGASVRGYSPMGISVLKKSSSTKKKTVEICKIIKDQQLDILMAYERHQILLKQEKKTPTLWNQWNANKIWCLQMWEHIADNI